MIEMSADSNYLHIFGNWIEKRQEEVKKSIKCHTDPDSDPDSRLRTGFRTRFDVTFHNSLF